MQWDNASVDSPRRDLPDRTFKFACEVVALCRELDRSQSVGKTLGKQLLRSATSIGANVEEAQGSQSRADFIAKSYIACKEARETHYGLRILAANEILPANRLSRLTDEARQLVLILTSVVRNTRANDQATPRPRTPIRTN